MGADGENTSSVIENKSKYSIEPELKALARRSVEMVIRRNIPNGASLNLTFCSYMTDFNGQVVGDSENYDPEANRVILATQSADWKKFKAAGLSDYQLIVLLAAHGAMHKCQDELGRPTTPTSQLTDEQYDNDPGEDEAWVESLHVLKAVFPKLKGSITVSGVKRTIPEESKYK